MVCSKFFLMAWFPRK